MRPTRTRTSLVLAIVIVAALLLAACQKSAPPVQDPPATQNPPSTQTADNTSTTQDPPATQDTPATQDPPATQNPPATQDQPASPQPAGNLTEEQVERFLAQIDAAAELYDRGGFDEAIDMLLAIIDEAPETKEPLQELLDLMEAGHPANFDIYPHIDDGAVMHDRRLIDLYDDMPPLMLGLYEVPATESYNAVLFSFDTDNWEWNLETIVFPDGCWYVSGLQSELRGIGSELVLYAHCDAAAPVTEVLIAWALDGDWMGTWNAVAGESAVVETLDLINGTRMLMAESDIETMTMWWDGEDFVDEFN